MEPPSPLLPFSPPSPPCSLFPWSTLLTGCFINSHLEEAGQHSGETLLPGLLAFILTGAHVRPSYGGAPITPIWGPCGLLQGTGHIFCSHAYPDSSAGHWAFLGLADGTKHGKKWKMLTPSVVSISCLLFHSRSWL